MKKQSLSQIRKCLTFVSSFSSRLLSILLLAVIGISTTGCGTIANLVQGRPSYYSPQHAPQKKIANNPFSPPTKLDGQPLIEFISLHSNAPSQGQVIDRWVNPSSIYGGIHYDYLWVTKCQNCDGIQPVLWRIIGVIDFPFSFIGDTLTAPYILLFEEDQPHYGG